MAGKLQATGLRRIVDDSWVYFSLQTIMISLNFVVLALYDAPEVCDAHILTECV